MNQKYSTLFFILFTTLSLSLSAQLYSYTNSTTGSYNTIAANTTAAGLSRINGAVAPATPCGSGFSSTGFSTTTVYSSSLAGVEADLTAAGGYALNITDFSVGIRRSGTGPASARLAYSIDGGATWIDQGSNQAPNNAGCGSTITATWTTAITVPSPSTLQFRIYCFDASGATGTFQVLDLNIDGTVSTHDSIFTTPTVLGPFCDNMNDSISLPFTTSSGTTSGLYYVQMSDASGNFPTDASSNLISTGDSISPLSAVIPAYTPWANGYRVRVVQQSPEFYGSGDNGSNIIINHADTSSFSISSDRSVICAGDTIIFTASNIVNGGLSPSIIWYINGDSVAADSVYTALLSNTDSVYATLTSSAVCTTPAQLQSSRIGITVYQPSGISLYDVLCPGESIDFAGISRTASGVYSDTFNTVNGCDSIVSLYLTVRDMHRDTAYASICQGNSINYNSHAFTAQGLYTDTLSCDTVHMLLLTVHSLPVPVISQQLALGLDTLTTGHYTGYQWYINGSAIAGATDEMYIASASAAGDYTVIVTDSNGCTDTSSDILLVYNGINEMSESGIHIYPNPSTGSIHIQLPSAITISSMTVTDMTGRTIYTGAFDASLDLSGLGDGMYLLSLKDTDGKIMSKPLSIIRK